MRMHRYVGIGSLVGRCFNLTLQRSKECGHWEAEGAGGSPAQVAARREVDALVQRLADEGDEVIEVYARHPRWGMWQVDSVHPTYVPPEPPPETDEELDRRYSE